VRPWSLLLFVLSKGLRHVTQKTSYCAGILLGTLLYLFLTRAFPVLTVLIILAIALSRVVISVWKRRALNISARSLPRSGFSRNFDHWVVVGIVSPIVGVIRVVRVVALAHRAGARWKIFNVVLFLTVL